MERPPRPCLTPDEIARGRAAGSPEPPSALGASDRSAQQRSARLPLLNCLITDPAIVKHLVVAPRVFRPTVHR